MSTIRRLSFASVLLGLGALVGGYFVFTRWLDRPLPIAADTLIEVLPGETLGRIGSRLGERSLIDHPGWFVAFGRLSDQSNRIQAGEYLLTSESTPRRFMAQLVSGRVVTYQVRIVEGWTFAQAMDALRRAPKLSDDLTGVSPSTILEHLGLGNGSAEGRFFPDTYQYRKGTAISALLRLAYERMTIVLADEWAARDAGLPYANATEALVLASVIEKETGVDADRDKVSRVFVARLQGRMRLQSDPTVIYGLGSNFDGNLTRRHLDTDGPYNSYQRSGLPPTPIALPGLASIRAALHPAPGDYLYFVARGDGSSEFTASLEDHVAAVRRFQQSGGAQPMGER